MPATLREAVLEQKLVVEADLVALESWAPYRGASLAERLYRSGLVADQHLVAAFAALGATDATGVVLHGLPLPAALGAFSRALAEKHRALPLTVEKRRLVVALLDPSDTTTLEKLTFTCGLVVEPRACRPRVLFEALHKAYDVVAVRPDGAFLESRRSRSTSIGLGFEDAAFDLPAPSTDVAARTFARTLRQGGHGAADVARSPIASALSEAADGIDIDINDSQPPLRKTLLEQRARDLGPARTPIIDPSALRAVTQNPPRDLVAARDSLPPQVLRLLVPPLRTCALFLVRKNVAVGWDVRSADGTVTTERVRDVLLPLSAPSVLSEAVSGRCAAFGNPRDPTTMERTLFRFLKTPPPRAFAALPVLAGDEVIAILYVDRDGAIDDGLIDEVRRAGAALGDAIAPLAAAGTLFPAPTLPLQIG